ncbi:hypothetical protein OIU89_11335 [Escherichia coli]|nr:hypothetical protein [Escherichia coli]
MPLYALGFMGMTRRLSQQIDPQFHTMLMIAASGAVLIALGILCLVIQMYVSIRDRDQNRDLTGDPWGGRTLEWATSSRLRSITLPLCRTFTSVMHSGK